MTPENLIQEYLSALEKSDINKIIQLFKEDAIVVSPLYGEIKASSFYPVFILNFLKIHWHQKSL